MFFIPGYWVHRNFGSHLAPGFRTFPMVPKTEQTSHGDCGFLQRESGYARLPWFFIGIFGFFNRQKVFAFCCWIPRISWLHTILRVPTNMVTTHLQHGFLKRLKATHLILGSQIVLGFTKYTWFPLER